MRYHSGKYIYISCSRNGVVGEKATMLEIYVMFEEITAIINELDISVADKNKIVKLLVIDGLSVIKTIMD